MHNGCSVLVRRRAGVVAVAVAVAAMRGGGAAAAERRRGTSGAQGLRRSGSPQRAGGHPRRRHRHAAGTLTRRSHASTRLPRRLLWQASNDGDARGGAAMARKPAVRSGQLQVARGCVRVIPAQGRTVSATAGVRTWWRSGEARENARQRARTAPAVCTTSVTYNKTTKQTPDARILASARHRAARPAQRAHAPARRWPAAASSAPPGGPSSAPAPRVPCRVPAAQQQPPLARSSLARLLAPSDTLALARRVRVRHHGGHSAARLHRGHQVVVAARRRRA
jgi:hypothetical protein